ncbi:heterokaryon incompatibility protein-domain-containing protein [Cercophora newfieldiana]|uniref:Heterokaryon incompatibility protein-domain-containing protein n=1 Tax=Cercophora newfieldiana TaxID=92897 RepID=A0AA39YBX8_9PEZI|nr:heterokaryon incompatibility protein-domain-containing protein [Cercophora newfieldiana]
MRLLDAETLEPTEFYGEDIPPYAILSHTWSKGEEITLQELLLVCGKPGQTDIDAAGKRVLAKKGYLKVKKAADRAREEKQVSGSLKWIWVDTCCIDKTNSAELSEAINSMYVWYKRSAICYVFLADVAGNGRGGENDLQLRRSKWFTRGWTLQELIAPAKINFFARDGTLLGQKSGNEDFSQLLSDITGIGVNVLARSIMPAGLSIATRMQWAARRETTRPEDMAYCLLGLFGVNMPLLYGEGASRAFLRLQEQIIQTTCDDQSIFAWTLEDDKPDSLHGLLARSPADFSRSGKIEAFVGASIHASAPSAMTSHGLHVQLHLEPLRTFRPRDADPDRKNGGFRKNKVARKDRRIREAIGWFSSDRSQYTTCSPIFKS